MAATLLDSPTLTESQFNKITKLVKGKCGINLHDGKQELVKARLAKRLRKLGLSDYRQYISYIERDSSGNELLAMLDAISTNLTSFFRESDHFEYFSKKVIPRIITNAGKTGRRLRIWSAGCSSGEEPYSIAICLCEGLRELSLWDAGILGTDISIRMLDRAGEGVYNGERVKTVPGLLRSKYFQCVQSRPDRLYLINQGLRKFVHFARLNLMDPWPMRGLLDAIFCRNVMIYFDKPTQQTLINRFSDLLLPGGTLFIGHSESLADINHGLRYVQPTVYQKP